MHLGDTFLLDTGCGMHLHVVVSHEVEQEKASVIVMISTWDDHRKNDSCIVRASDGHPFITHDSYVVYSTAKMITDTDITLLQGKSKQPFSQEVVQRIIKGADSYRSDFPQKYWLILDKQGLFK
jgi:DNA-binding GntR family transcriptional regulator